MEPRTAQIRARREETGTRWSGGPPIRGLLAGGAGHALALAAAGAFAQPPVLPSDGSVAFSYTRDPQVIGCSQTTEAEMRDLIEGVVHLSPFVPAGKTAPFSLRVDVTRPRENSVVATFSLFRQDGSSMGKSTVEDTTCDGAQLKLAASIAVLLQPKPASPPACPPCPGPGCDQACRDTVAAQLRDEVKKQVRQEELPRLRAEVQKELEARIPPTPPIRGVIAAGPVLGLNFGSDVSPGFWLSGEVRGERWSVSLETRSLFPSRAFVLQDKQSTVDIGAMSGVLSPCVRWHWLGGCALVEAGGFWVAGTAAMGGDPKGLLLALGGRLRLDVPIAFGFEGRLFADAVGHLVGINSHGLDPTGPTGASNPTPFTFKAPREFSAFLGLGLARVF
jgi:hypothetical protein